MLFMHLQSQSVLEPSQKCDIIRGKTIFRTRGQRVQLVRLIIAPTTNAATILVVGSVGLGYLDTSALYHVIRGQSVIKLYVMYNMLEVRRKRMGAMVASLVGLK